MLPQCLTGYPEPRCGWEESGVLGHELTIMGIRQVQWQGQLSQAWEWALQSAPLTGTCSVLPTLSTAMTQLHNTSLPP